MRRLSLALFVAYALNAAYDPLSHWLHWPRPSWLVHLLTVSYFLFAVVHAGTYLGWRNALTFWGISFGVSLAFESAGVATGAFYGPYHYGDKLGPKLFGLVPVLIPMAWFMMVYSTHGLVAVLAPGRRRSVWWAVWLAGVSAVAMTAWDLSMDPAMVGGGFWTWHQPGPFFGIPISNYLGWLETTFVVYLLYRLLELRWPPRDERLDWFGLLPFGAYILTWLNQVFSRTLTGHPELGLTAFFAMGAFVLAALTTLVHKRQ
ncbi:MAG TPA: carotenoid biosynthesis protein [Symbiobacteriaceae bacterium]|nr:carotenoid biosynthesis protein [Symbiobacteriaceae bacterium]